MKQLLSAEDFKKVMAVHETMFRGVPDNWKEDNKNKPREATFTAQGRRVIFIDDRIDPFDGINARQIRQELAGHSGDLLMIVNSEGGDVHEAVSIADILAQVDGEVHAHVAGLAASAASYLIMGADRITMTSLSQIMIHRARSLTIGDVNRHQEKAEALEIIDNGAAAAYSERTNIPIEEILTMMNRDTYLSAEESVRQGFADEVVTEAYSLNEPNQMSAEQEEEPENNIDVKSINKHEEINRRVALAVATKRFLELKNTAEQL